MIKIKSFPVLPFTLYFLTFIFCLSAFSQNLTVRNIMAEPSFAGMRPDSVRLSPDGNWVIFSWNPEGKEPRNLYIVSTYSSQAEPRLLLSGGRSPRSPIGDERPPENKLNYGLELNDEFSRSRAGGSFFGVEFSPDSKRILYPQGNDLYIMDLEKTLGKRNVSNDIKPVWTKYESLIIRRADLIPNVVELMKKNNIVEPEAFGYAADARAKLLNAVNEAAKGQNGDKSEDQKQAILKADEYLDACIKRLTSLQDKYPKLSKNEAFLKLLDELAGTENRINVARNDYDTSVKYAQNDDKPRRIMRTQGTGGARWLGNDRILYQSSGNYFVLDIKETSITQVTRDSNPEKFINVTNAVAGKDGKLLAYVLTDSSAQRPLFVPNYLGEFVQAPSYRRGFSTQKVFVAQTDGSRMRSFEINLPKAEGASYFRSLKWAADNSSLIIDRVDKDLKRRQLFYVHNVGSKAENIITLTEETDEKWVASLSRIVEPNPKNPSEILFASERDGFNHLYLATLERAKTQPNPNSEQRQENISNAGFTSNVKIDQLTKGDFEVDWAKWTAGTGEIIFSSTEGNTAERQFYSLKNGKRVPIPTSEKGMMTNPQLNEEGNDRPTLLYEFSKWNQPGELYAVQLCTGCAGINYPVQLTKSTPESFKQLKWIEPKFIDIPTKDNKKVKAKIYLPDNFEQNRSKQNYPMVFFVHGAGYLQNTINGWNNYYREFMFNEMLVKKGYIVLDIDYRGSAGYGRDWRTDVYDFLGGKDYDDHLDAIDFAVKNYSVDPNKIGVYGGSYGGFMAEMLVFRAPEKIAAAAALRPVADWKNYFASSPVYTAERLGFPEKNPDGYRRSSPIAYADKLQKPLLILHGLVDNNVPAQDSMQLIEKLIRLEKTQFFEAMIYPSENHAFDRPTSWTDEYTRILTFFDKHLK